MPEINVHSFLWVALWLCSVAPHHWWISEILEFRPLFGMGGIANK